MQHFKNYTKTSFWKGGKKKWWIISILSVEINAVQDTFKKLLTFDREATFLRAIWLQLSLISLLMSCWVRCVSHTQQFYCQADSKHALALRESLCVISMRHKTHPYLQTAAHGSSVAFFPVLDWHSLCSKALCLQGLWHSKPLQLWCLWALVPSGASGSQLSTYHFIFERLKYQVRLLNSWKEVEWFLWTVICRRPQCRCRHLL